MTPDEIIELLGLRPHPEGGHFVETWRAVQPTPDGAVQPTPDGAVQPTPDGAGGRAAGTAIYFLLRHGEVSHWHRVDAAEVWHHYAGDPLELAVAAVDPGAPDGAGVVHRHVLGPHLAAGERPQVVVPAHAWQAARPLGAWTLVGCTVSPAFEFAGFELAAPEWAPDARA